jgi:hypothetical protein
MLRSLKLLFSASAEWQKMSLSPPHPALVFFISLLPLVAITLAVEAFGLIRLGETIGEFGLVQLPQQRILRYVVFYAIASIAVILVGSALLWSIAPSFNLQTGFGTWLVLMGYCYAPIYLSRLPDALPQINSWVCYAIGAALTVRVLYHGVAYWLKPEQTKGLGVLLMSVILIVVLSGLVHFASIQVLHGRLLRPRQTEVDSGTSPEVFSTARTNAAPVGSTSK